MPWEQRQSRGWGGALAAGAFLVAGVYCFLKFGASERVPVN